MNELSSGSIRKLSLVEAHEAYPDVGGHGNENGIDEIKEESSGKVSQIASCQSVTGRTERWHECRCDGHSGMTLPLSLAHCAVMRRHRQRGL